MKSLLCALLAFGFVVSARAGELQDAAGRGELEKVRALIQASPASVNARVSGTTALHEAARAGHLEVVKLLVAGGANVNATDFSNLTPLKLATKHPAVAQFLRAHGAQEKAVTVTTPVPRPATATNPPATTLFNTKPAAPVAASPTNAEPAIISRLATEQELMPVMFPIHEAARVGDVERIKSLFKTAPDLVDATDQKGLTPLHVAAANNQFAVAQTLLALRAKASPRSTAGLTPLHLAVRHGSVAVAGLLLTNRAEVNARDKFDNTPLLLALQSANSESVENQSVLGEKTGVSDWTALLLRQFELVQLLLAYRAEVNVRNRAGLTPLAEVARIGNEPVVNLLLQAGADPNAPESTGGIVPLHLAAARGHAGIVQALLRHRADVNAADARGDTPLGHALREGRTNTIALLRQAGGNIGPSRPLSAGEKTLVDFYEHTEMTLRLGNTSEKKRALLALNPTKADVTRMFPQHADAAWKIVAEANKEIETLLGSLRDAEGQKEIWRIRPEPPGPGTQDWRARGWLAPDLLVLALAVDRTGGTTRPGDYCFVNNHWVLIPPLRQIAAQAAPAPKRPGAR